MQLGVRWVYQTVKVHGKAVEAGLKPALCLTGYKHMFCVAVGHPLRVLKRPVEDFGRLDPVMLGNKEYPVAKAIETLQQIAGRCGITLGASKLLDRAVEKAAIEDEDQFINEEDEMEKPGGEVTEGADTSESTTTSAEPSAKETKVKAKRAPKKAAAKAASKANGAAKRANGKSKDKGPSACALACDYMREEVKKEGGAKALERGFLKELFERTGKKFGLKASTAGIQYNRNVLNKGAHAGKR